MKSYRRWMTTAMLLALVATGAVVTAQDKPADKADKAAKAKQKAEADIMLQGGGEFFFAGQEPGAPPRVWSADAGTMTFVASEMVPVGQAVKGAPYSAQAVTEMIQTLADGNRIVHKTTTSVYRDSEGRTRNDQAMGNFGPYATAGEPSQVILINDPVSGVHYTLDPRTKTGRKLSFQGMKMISDDANAASELTVAGEAGASADKHAAEADAMRGTVERHPESGAHPHRLPPSLLAVEPEVEMHSVAGEHMRVPMGKAGVLMGETATFNVKLQEPKIEQLGKQTMEGVEAEGQRATITIPAGEIGNEQPIQIVSESWYSPELQMTVMTRHSDPRMGETVYKLTSITRAEPARSLFEVPPDYTVKEAVEPKMKMLLDRERQRTRKSADKPNN